MTNTHRIHNALHHYLQENPPCAPTPVPPATGPTAPTPAAGAGDAAPPAASPCATSPASTPGPIYTPLSVAHGLLQNATMRCLCLCDQFETYQRRGLSLAKHLAAVQDLEQAARDINGAIAILAEIQHHLLTQGDPS